MMTFFGNQGIKRVMTKNRCEEISQHLHFSDSTKEPARGAVNKDHLIKVRTVIDYVGGVVSSKGRRYGTIGYQAIPF